MSATPTPAAVNNSTTAAEKAMYDQYYETLRVERIIGITVPTIFAIIIAVGLVGNVLVS